jgi:hypothetical protein
MNPTRTRYLKLLVLACLVGWFVMFIWGTVWRQQRDRENRELTLLYQLSCGGDHASLYQLSGHVSAEATLKLELLSKEQACMADARVAAINLLGSKGHLDADDLNLLLRINEPFDVRHATVEAFVQHGCNRKCVATALDSLHELSQGQPALEELLEAQLETELKKIQPPADYQRAIGVSRQQLESLHIKAEADYFTLLSGNPCITREILRTDYATDDRFIELVMGKIPNC